MIITLSLRPIFILSALVIVFFILHAPVVEAQYADGGSRYSRTTSRAIDRLDDDAVEKFPIPVLFGVTLKDITSDFGDPRGGGTREHEGQDIMAPKGTPIVSPTDAVVTRVGTGESAGKYVYTANPGGESWRYMHLDDIADIKAGDVLEEGDYIGTVGNTGNASEVAPHLHFEVRKREALDPYPRLGEAYPLKEKMTFVTRFFRDIDDEDEMAEFLVGTFLADFTKAMDSGYTLPNEIIASLKDRGIVDTSELQTQLSELVASIPGVVSPTLGLGDTNASVSLMQFYLIYTQTGPAVNQLRQSGATGYFGPLTEATFREYQTAQGIEVTGKYDAETQKAMINT